MDGLATPQRYLAMTVILLAAILASMDVTLVNVALPSIVDDLGIEPSRSIWIVSAFQITAAISLLPTAALGERVGYRKVFLSGLVLYTLAALASALAPNLTALCVSRAAQGLGAGAILSVFPAIVRFTYPEAMLGRAVGWNGLAVMGSAALGPVIGVALLAIADWRWLFAVNVPIGLIALSLGRSLPANPVSHRHLHPISILLNAVALISIIMAVKTLPFNPPTGIALIAVFLISGALLVRRERKTAVPLLPIDLLSNSRFSNALANSICIFSAQMLGFICLPFFLTQSHHSGWSLALLLGAWPAASGIVASFSGRLADHLPGRALCSVGAFVSAVALFIMADLEAVSLIKFLALTCLTGVGVGLFVPPNNRTLIVEAPRKRSGAAGGLQATARIFGQSLGAALMAIIFPLAGTADAPRTAMAVAASLATAACLLSLTELARKRQWKPRPETGTSTLSGD